MFVSYGATPTVRDLCNNHERVSNRGNDSNKAVKTDKESVMILHGSSPSIWDICWSQPGHSSVFSSQLKRAGNKSTRVTRVSNIPRDRSGKGEGGGSWWDFLSCH